MKYLFSIIKYFSVSFLKRLDPLLGRAVTDDDYDYDEEVGEQEALFMTRSLTEAAGAEIAVEAGRGMDRGSRRRRSRAREHRPMRKQGQNQSLCSFYYLFCYCSGMVRKIPCVWKDE